MPTTASGAGSGDGVAAEADCTETASGTAGTAVTVAVLSGVDEGWAINGIPTPSAMNGPDGGATSGVDTDAAAAGDSWSSSGPVGTARIGDSELRFRLCPVAGAPVPVPAKSGAASVAPRLGSEPNPADPAAMTGFARAAAVAPSRRGPAFVEADGRVVLGESASDDAVPTAPPEPVESA